MTTRKKTALALAGRGSLASPEFHQLADVPPEAEWFANIQNPNTRRAYKNHVLEFSKRWKIRRPEQLRTVTRAHVIQWRDELTAQNEPAQSPATVRAKLSALSSLFKYLTDNNAVTHNPVTGVKRPGEGSNEGKTAALSDGQAKKLLAAPDQRTSRGKRDAAIISTLLHHGLRREELCSLKVSDITQRRGVLYLRVLGKRDKIRYVEYHPDTAELIHDYLVSFGHSEDKRGPLFRPLLNNYTKVYRKGLHPQSIARIVHGYALLAGIDAESFSAHVTRVTAATKAHENGADLHELKEWLGHSSEATTGLYIRRRYAPEKSPTFKTNY